MSHACLSPRYRKGPEWDAAVARFAASTDDAWCGPVGPAPSLGYAAWAIWLAEYWRIAPPAVERHASDPLDIPAGNAVYREPRVTDDEFALDFHAALLQRGAKVRIVAAMEAALADPPPLASYLSERYAQSRRFGRAGRRGPLLRIGLPAILLARWYGAAVRKPRYLPRAIVSLPLLVLFSLVQCAGEVAGSLAAE